MPITKRGKSPLINGLLYFVGAVLYALSICSFVRPNLLVTGGFSGIAIILNRLFGVPVGLCVFALNLPLFCISARFLGKRFVLASVVATAMLSVLIDAAQPYLPRLTDDRALAALIGGVLSGSGLALIFIRGGSTGGADMISKLVHLKYPHLAIGKMIMAIDLSVIALSALLFRGIENALFSAVMTAVSAATVDYFIYGAKSGKMLLAVTRNGEDAAHKVNALGKRGATLIPVIGAYTKHPLYMLMIVVKAHEIGKIYTIIHESDPEAFITLLNAGEITGRGFEQYYE